MFAGLFPSRTVAFALTLITVLSRAFDLGKADEWVYDKLPFGLGQNGTFEEFKRVIASGKVFLKDCYDFFHK